MVKRKRFYEEGLHFECQGSGKCCLKRGDYGYVYVTYRDRRRLAAYLGISTHIFTKQYTEITDELFHLKDPDKNCFFLKDNHCVVYDARPEQCRTWPFWSENMSRRVWEQEIGSYCPGVGKGKRYTAEEIEEILASGKDIPGYGNETDRK